MMVKIRKANPNDAKQIAQTHLFSWHATYQGLIPPEFLNSYTLEKREQDWSEYLVNKDIAIWVAEEMSNIIGFASLCPSREKNHDTTKIAEISSIYLLPEFWGKGLGKQLCQILLQNALKNGFSEIIAWVLETNQNARAFYETMGFNLTGDFKNDHIGCDALKVLLYKKELLPRFL